MTAHPSFDAAEFVALRGLAPPGLRLTTETLAGGYWNQVARVQGRGLDLVVKRFHAGRGPLRFPNLPHAEAAALKRLTPTGQVPRFRAFFDREDDGQPILVYDFVAGRVGEGRPEAVGAALRAIHALTLPEDPHPFRRLAYRAASMRLESQRLFEETPGAAESPRAQALLAVPLPDEPLPRPAALCVVHTDCGPGNLVAAPDGRVVVIDWQAAGAGDPAEDLYAYLSPAFQTLSQRLPLHSGERARFLVAHGDAAAEARLQTLWRHYSWRMLAYCAARHVSLAAEDPAASERYARAFDLEFKESFQR